jgi:hypothetical protein
MSRRRLGIKLIAAYLCLKALVLFLVVATVYERPELQPEANKLVLYLIPALQNYQIDNRVIIAPLFIIFYLILGLGIWFLKKWAWTIIVVDLSWAFARSAVSLSMLIVFDRKTLQLLEFPPYLAANILLSFFVLVYLINSDVKQAFGWRQ